MKNFILASAVIFGSVGCTDSIIEKAGAECQEILEEVIPQIKEDIWKECTGYYEEHVLPEMKKIMDEALVNIKKHFDELLKAKEEQIFNMLGCFYSSDSVSWDCTGTIVCQER